MFVEEIYWKIKLPLSPYKPGRAETVQGALPEIHLNNCIRFKIKLWGQTRGGNSPCTQWCWSGFMTRDVQQEKTKTKKTRENNRNVASYLKACKLAMISLCNHNQELNIPTQASNNNIYKFSMGKLFSSKKNWLLGSQKCIHLLHGDPQITAKSNLQHSTLPSYKTVLRKKEKKDGLHSNSNI